MIYSTFGPLLIVIFCCCQHQLIITPGCIQDATTRACCRQRYRDNPVSQGWTSTMRI